MQIRPEKSDDYKTIYELIKTAFKTAQVSNGKEQDFAESLRSFSTYLPELALVAKTNEGIIGHIMVTEISISGQGGEKWTSLLVAPLSVALEHRSQGIGSNLMKEAINRAKNAGYDSMFLVGNPEYYSRFGFKSISDFDLKACMDIPLQYVQGLELSPGVLESRRGGTVELG